MDISLIVNKSEIGAGTRGASLGFEALKVAAWKQKNPIFDDYKPLLLKDYNHILSTPPVNLQAKRIPAMLGMYRDLSQVIKDNVDSEKFTLAISGDHSCAGATISGFKRAFPNDRIGVVWIDAHADLHTPYTSPSGNMHGMPLGAALGLDENGDKTINQIEKDLWKQLISVGNITPKLMPQDLCFVGVRSTELAENEIISKYNIPNYTVDTLRNLGIAATVKNIFNHLSNCDKIYISFDVDVLDPDAVSYGTGTPVANGLELAEVRELLMRLLDDTRSICLEVVEINPCLETKQNAMAEAVLPIIEDCIGTVKNRNA